MLLLLLLLLQVHDLQERIRHEEQERIDLKRKADDKEERAAKVGFLQTVLHSAAAEVFRRTVVVPLASASVALVGLLALCARLLGVVSAAWCVWLHCFMFSAPPCTTMRTWVYAWFYCSGCCC
jgi:hypothetical protein